MSGLLQALGDGLLNPILSPAHALTLVVLGLLVGQQESRISLLAFAIGLAPGLSAIALAVGETPARTVLLADAALIGAMVAAAWTPPKVVVWIVAAVAGAALALDSPPQAVTIIEGYATLAGTAAGASAILLVAAVAAGQAKPGWQRLGVRILGSWIAASAILALAVLLR